jgi:phage N-6-adenine-methyltransferase
MIATTVATGAVALTKPSTKRRPRNCRQCGTPITQPNTGRPRQYCSKACRQKAHASRGRVPVYFSHQRDDWTTPLDLFQELDAEFGFTLDAAATAENALCASYFTAEDDGLDQEWSGTVFCNPPYSQVAKWVEKAHRASLDGVTTVLLLAARTDTRWWHGFVEGKAEYRFVKGRLTFGSATNSAPFPSAVVIFRGSPAQAATA